MTYNQIIAAIPDHIKQNRKKDRWLILEPGDLYAYTWTPDGHRIVSITRVDLNQDPALGSEEIRTIEHSLSFWISDHDVLFVTTNLEQFFDSLWREESDHSNNPPGS